MNYFIDEAHHSLNKYGEELCGDKVEIVNTEDSMIIVMADGLGSGVKANILSTLTSKIAATMLKEGASIYETVDTIVHTLPVCNVRKIAYSTFTIIKVHNDGRVYIAEYDNPPFFLIRGKDLFNVEKTEGLINGKIVKESKFIMNEDDVLTVVSDGAIHAGVGAILNLGWQWGNIADYLKRSVIKSKCANSISVDLLMACKCLYADMPGDDTTVVTVKVREPQIVDVLLGPPQNRDMDKFIINRFMDSKGKRIICGGTAANIAARELGEEIAVDMEYYDLDVPPTANIRGMDLVTEGVLTISKTVDKIKNYIDKFLEDGYSNQFEGKDGASKLARILIEDCTHVNFWIGKAENPVHQYPEFPFDLSRKLHLAEELVILMKRMGKMVEVKYL